MAMTRAELERVIAAISAEVSRPIAGLHGPGSMSWQIGKEVVLFAGGGRAALLQLAHPFVAHAVDQHSATRTDPLGRFRRTFDNVYAIVFGELEQAFRSARRVHAIHARISGRIEEDVGRFARGAAYHANDEEALLWVHATLIDTAVVVYDAIVRRLSEAEKDRYYQEGKRFARLFGIGESVLPRDWDAFRDYFDSMIASDTIAVGAPAREMAKFLFLPKKRAMRPVFRWAALMTAGFMPARLRAGFELEYGALEHARFRSSLALLRATYPLLPERLRHVPAYVEARRRLEGRSGPDRVGRWLERLAVRGLDLGGA